MGGDSGSALAAQCSASIVFALSFLLSLLSAKMTLQCVCRIQGGNHLLDGKKQIQTLRSWQYPESQKLAGTV